MRVRISTWASNFLLVYMALVTLTPARHVFSGLGAHIFLAAGTATILTLSFLKLLSSGSQVTSYSYAIVAQAPLLGILAAYVLSLLFIGDNIGLNRLDALRDFAIPMVVYLLVGYLALRASGSGVPVPLMRGIISILSFAAIIGMALSLVHMTSLDALRFFGFSPSRESVEILLDIDEVRFLGLQRAQGFFAHPIEYAATLFLAYSLVRVRPAVIGHRFLRWSICLLLVTAIFLSGTRSVWLGIVLVELILRYSSLQKKLGKIVIVVASISVAAAFLFLSFEAFTLYNTLRSSSNPLDQSIALRLADYEVVFGTLIDHPFGVGDWQYYAESHGMVRSTPNFYLDNDYLRFLATTGVVGLIAYVVFVFRGLLLAPYFLTKYDRLLVLVLTLSYAFLAATFDAFSFRVYTAVYVALLTVALRLR